MMLGECRRMSDDVEALRELNDSYLESVRMGDVDRFREILADDFLCSAADGAVLDKTQFLELTAGPRTLRHLSADDVRIRVLWRRRDHPRGDLLHDHDRAATAAAATPTSGQKRDGTWRAVAAHVTRPCDNGLEEQALGSSRAMALAPCDSPCRARGPGRAQDAGLAGQRRRRQHPLLAARRRSTATTSSTLQVAWTYDSHDAFKGSEMQSNPIVVDGVLYATTPTLKVVAVDAATGREIWKFDPSGGARRGARFRHRGVTVHKDRVFVTYRSFLWALDKKTGQPIASFGTDGRIDLREGLGQPAERLSVSASTPGVDLRGPADHRQHRCPRRCPDRPATSARST